MEYDDQVTPGHFSRHLIPLAKILVKKMAERVDIACKTGMFYNVQPLQSSPDPVNQVTIED